MFSFYFLLKPGSPQRPEGEPRQARKGATVSPKDVCGKAPALLGRKTFEGERMRTFVITTIKIGELRQEWEKCKNSHNKWVTIYERIGIPNDFLEKGPYIYIWIKNIGTESEKVIYIGATGGNGNKRGVAIVNQILEGSHSHTIKECFEKNSSLFSEEDTLTIILIPTKGKEEALLLERALLCCLSKKSMCNEE